MKETRIEGDKDCTGSMSSSEDLDSELESIAAEPEPEIEHAKDTVVQCDLCNKWRHIPISLLKDLPDQWCVSTMPNTSTDKHLPLLPNVSTISTILQELRVEYMGYEIRKVFHSAGVVSVYLSVKISLRTEIINIQLDPTL